MAIVIVGFNAFLFLVLKWSRVPYKSIHHLDCYEPSARRWNGLIEDCQISTSVIVERKEAGGTEKHERGSGFPEDEAANKVC